VEGSSQFVPSAAGSAPALVTVDAAGAIGFAWAGAGGGTGSISATFLPEGRHLGAWPIALEADPTFVAVMAGGRFLLAGGGGGKGNLAAISLYGQADPCSLE
jgi:hypothetical protein